MKILLALFILAIGIRGQNRNLLFEQEQDPFVMTVTAASVTISMKGTGVIGVNWGDGKSTNYTLTSTPQSVTHSYSGSALYKVIIYNPHQVTYWSSSDSANYSFNWVETKKLRLTYFVCLGTNGISGKLSLPSVMTTFILTGANTLSGYSTQTFSDNINYFYLITSLGTGFTAAEIDQLIIDLDKSAWGGASRTLRLTGSKIAAPTATSSDARTSLTAKSVSQTYNP